MDFQRSDENRCGSHPKFIEFEYKVAESESEHEEGSGFIFDDYPWRYNNFITCSYFIHRQATALIETFTNLCNGNKSAIHKEFINLVSNRQEMDWMIFYYHWQC